MIFDMGQVRADPVAIGDVAAEWPVDLEVGMADHPSRVKYYLCLCKSRWV